MKKTKPVQGVSSIKLTNGVEDCVLMACVLTTACIMRPYLFLNARPTMRLLADLYLGVFKVCDNVLHSEVYISEVKYFQSLSYHSTVILTFN